jgi:FtsP/CotA-like multicopper oxidase with cupredoxin domain
MDRRNFLLGSAALACVPRIGLGQTRRIRVAAAKHNLVGAAHPATEVWAYDRSVPGPELRFRQGERLRIDVENALAQETTVHWHGIRLPNAMDGVPHLTQPPIAANGGRFVYEFDLPDAGTYWYHPHLGEGEQLGRGLYGALIVEERDRPPVDRDLAWVLSDWRLDREARVRPDFGNAMDASHAGRIGNTVTLNGVVPDFFPVRAGERLRLRLINASSARIYGLNFEGHEPWVIALDGHPVTPHWFQRVVLGPGMRADVILDCTAAPGSLHRVVDDFYRGRAYELLKMRYGDEKPLRQAFEPAPRLAPNPVKEPDASAQRHRIVLGGGMMGAMPSQREHKGVFWTVNGKAMRGAAMRGEAMHHGGHDDPPLLALKLGQSCVVELVNETAWHHPMHLHGHVFRVLSKNGKEVLPRQWADTVLLDPDSRAEIAFVADNPGSWMLHCHVLEHQASGMMGVVRVA